MPCTVSGIWNAAGKLDTSKSPVPTFCQFLPPECALGLTMDLACRYEVIGHTLLFTLAEILPGKSGSKFA